MKKIIILLVLATTILACKTEVKKAGTNNTTTVEKITETPSILLGEFDTKAGDFVNKEVKVTGIVDHICKHGGKKILLVTDEGDVHITSEERFDEDLMGSELELTGIVLEERIDEAYLLKMEEDNIKSHSEGASNKEQFENKKKHVAEYRAKMEADGVNHISNYSLQYVSFKELK